MLVICFIHDCNTFVRNLIPYFSPGFTKFWCLANDDLILNGRKCYTVTVSVAGWSMTLFTSNTFINEIYFAQCCGAEFTNVSIQ